MCLGVMSYQPLCDYFGYLLGETITSGTEGVTSERRKLDVQAQYRILFSASHLQQ
jgi:hypothetical protein